MMFTGGFRFFENETKLKENESKLTVQKGYRPSFFLVQRLVPGKKVRFRIGFSKTRKEQF